MAYGRWATCTVLFLLFVGSVKSLSEADLFPYGVNQDQSLPRENDISSAEVQLSTPITFYGTEYSTLYVNDNGIVSFLTEVPSFFSAPFPLTYPIMAPLYSDVDTRSAGRVFYRETQEPSLLARFEQLVGTNFAAGASFRARSLFVATWDGVGHYERKADRRNTFQLVVGSEPGRAYALLLYPHAGVQWVLADPKSPGHPDAKAQAGFMAGDGRRFTALRGSGTDHVVNLDKMSNTAVPGQWLYHISGSEVVGPDLVNTETLSGGATCMAAREPCPPSTVCRDYDTGFCCHCDRGFFGNGKNCIADGSPQRVTGKLTGSLNDAPIGGEVDFHSYVDTTNGRTYTALSRVSPPSLGSDLRALLVLGDVVGWLFALPQGDRARSGFVLTGAECNLTSEVRFKQTGHHVTVRGQFQGFDVFNMMQVRIEVRGSLPSVAQGRGVTVEDFTQDYNLLSAGLVQSHLSHSFQLEGSSLPIEYTVDTTVSFVQCPHIPAGAPQQRVHVSRNFIDFADKDGIVRYAQTTKVTAVDGSDPCQGVECGEHSRCVPDGAEKRCQCDAGYEALTLPQRASAACVDVDECQSGRHNCHVHAECANTDGGFACRCRPGYTGDGVSCQRLEAPTCASLRCDPAAECVQPSPRHPPQCRCPVGYTGDGSTCVPAATDCRQRPLMCDEHAQCQYDPPTRTYGCKCRTGWRGDGSFCAQESCLEANDCHSDAQCTYDMQMDSYYCACNPGFSGDGYVCYPHGGAQRPGCNVVADCHPYAQCVYNASAGQHQCRCMPGYRGDGYQCVHSREPGCETSGDCAPVGGACVAMADGRRECRCLEGFEGDGRRCQPLDECSSADQCDANAQCAYDGQRYRCVCAHGYRGDGRTCRPPVDPACDCGPNARCVFDPSTQSQRCVCVPGTEGDGYVCRPTVERPLSCLDDPSLCSRNADCVAADTTGHVCQCQPGFTGDGRTCAPAPRATGEEYLLFGQGMSILQMPLEPSKSSPGRLLLMEPHQTVVGIAADCVEHRIYWTDAASGTVRRAFYNGSEPEVFRAGLRSPEGVAIDWASRNLFWTDSVDDTVEVASLDGAYHHVIVNTGLVNPRGIAVHPALGRLYWSDWDRRSPRIESCHMDGSGRLVLVEGGGLETPNMLALDLQHNDLCWTDAGRRTVECVNLNGLGRRVVYTPAQYPFGLAVAAGKVYWTDWTIPFIHMVDRNGGTAEPLKLPLGGNGKLYGITAVSEKCPQLTNACSHLNGRCRHLCLPSGQWGRTCHCGGNSTACNEVSA
ncbi:nidogen-like [Dermacentor albipictus]|uniref:nidogen-like n=1 Tax=Dermacentor albipictus TaxID=60249 RepID=UPI0031FD39EF